MTRFVRVTKLARNNRSQFSECFFYQVPMHKVPSENGNSMYPDLRDTNSYHLWHNSQTQACLGFPLNKLTCTQFFTLVFRAHCIKCTFSRTYELFRKAHMAMYRFKASGIWRSVGWQTPNIRRRDLPSLPIQTFYTRSCTHGHGFCLIWNYYFS